MNGDKFIKYMSLGILVFAPIFSFILIFTNPGQGSYPIIAFFISIFFLVWCVLAPLLYFLKRKAQNNELYFANIKSSMREGLFAAIFIVVMLGLALIKLLTWWDSLLLAFALVLLELYFISDKEGAK